ncbi:Potassium voltage-gated channel subfamily A member 5 [Frankliniella fusca]|uniref:Potassium voltage-gated channel subfamily A member 5 n=1 Tax=Frankliniella fusca TaxID=407009 RepID=A0AAE1LGB1_9NEOP|nr:Potassium voltage-gated channel subfamily A member 5 [Frankliniella fusca]
MWGYAGVEGEQGEIKVKYSVNEKGEGDRRRGSGTETGLANKTGGPITSTDSIASLKALLKAESYLKMKRIT